MVGHGPGPCGRYSQPVSSSPSTERSRRSSGLVSSSAFTLGVLAPRELARVWLPVLLSGVAAQLASSIDQTPRGSYQLSAVSASREPVGKNRHSSTTSRGSGSTGRSVPCLLYTSDAADDLLCVDLGGRRIIKK